MLQKEFLLPGATHLSAGSTPGPQAITRGAPGTLAREPLVQRSRRGRLEYCMPGRLESDCVAKSQTRTFIAQWKEETKGTIILYFRGLLRHSERAAEKAMTN